MSSHLQPVLPAASESQVLACAWINDQLFKIKTTWLAQVHDVVIGSDFPLNNNDLLQLPFAFSTCVSVWSACIAHCCRSLIFLILSSCTQCVGLGPFLIQYIFWDSKLGFYFCLSFPGQFPVSKINGVLFFLVLFSKSFSFLLFLSPFHFLCVVQCAFLP